MLYSKCVICQKSVIQWSIRVTFEEIVPTVHNVKFFRGGGYYNYSLFSFYHYSPEVQLCLAVQYKRCQGFFLNLFYGERGKVAPPLEVLRGRSTRGEG